MHTKDMLAEALRAVGLNDMAAKAADGYYHDFLSPLALPEIQLAEDLAEAAQACPDADRRQRITAVRNRHLQGEFDANVEESEAWAASPEGQDAFRRLVRGE